MTLNDLMQHHRGDLGNPSLKAGAAKDRDGDAQPKAAQGGLALKTSPPKAGFGRIYQCGLCQPQASAWGGPTKDTAMTTDSLAGRGDQVSGTN
jgi:hypothetical protein